MEREVGGGIGMGNTCKPMAVSFQCMTKSTTQKKIIIIKYKWNNQKKKTVFNDSSIHAHNIPERQGLALTSILRADN